MWMWDFKVVILLLIYRRERYVLKTILADLRCKRKNMQLLYGYYNRVAEFQNLMLLKDGFVSAPIGTEIPAWEFAFW